MELKYISEISYNSLRNIILDEELSENDTIVLNLENFDEIVLEYRNFYNENMIIPHLLLGVLIREADNESIPINRIGVIKNDSESIRTVNKNKYEYYDGEVFYRCGWCGNIIDENGNVLEGHERQRAISCIENDPKPIIKQKNGKCCRNYE